jgi:hypothetical protein
LWYRHCKVKYYFFNIQILSNFFFKLIQLDWIGLDWIGATTGPTEQERPLDQPSRSDRWIGLERPLDQPSRSDRWIGLDWSDHWANRAGAATGLDWIGLDWIGLDWIGATTGPTEQERPLDQPSRSDRWTNRAGTTEKIRPIGQPSRSDRWINYNNTFF